MTQGGLLHGDFLPLPNSEPGIDWLMRGIEAADTARLRATRLARCFFMIFITLNYRYHWGLWTSGAPEALLFGTPSSVQLAAQMGALQKLAGAADAMIRLSPGQLRLKDGRCDLGRTQVSYQWGEVSTAIPLASSLVLQGLPPQRHHLCPGISYPSSRDWHAKPCCPRSWRVSQKLKWNLICLNLACSLLTMRARRTCCVAFVI